MKRLSKIAFLSIVSGLFFFACQKKNCGDVIPELSYKSIKLTGSSAAPDSLTLTYKFKDCDGDIGLDAADTLGPFHKDSANYYNLRIDLFFFRNNKWNKAPVAAGAPGFNSRVPVLNKTGKSQVLEGEVDKVISGKELQIFKYDTVRFEARLFDKGLNGSNKVVTPIYIFSF